MKERKIEVFVGPDSLASIGRKIRAGNKPTHLKEALEHIRKAQVLLAESNNWNLLLETVDAREAIEQALQGKDKE